MTGSEMEGMQGVGKGSVWVSGSTCPLESAHRERLDRVEPDLSLVLLGQVQSLESDVPKDASLHKLHQVELAAYYGLILAQPIYTWRWHPLRLLVRGERVVVRPDRREDQVLSLDRVGRLGQQRSRWLPAEHGRVVAEEGRPRT